ILIYCNNNFEDDVEPVMLKRAPLALNIPTFINLVGYGYENVYELGELVSIRDETVNWVG
ncbi:MAG: rhodanese-like domain-containing protein, partial [Pseudomonadota bacterium]|nr:rhodanese-like domain-containing protein [Pseudomonadota bacterium]